MRSATSLHRGNVGMDEHEYVFQNQLDRRLFEMMRQLLMGSSK